MDTDTVHVVAGLEGKLSQRMQFLAGWRWNVAYSYGRRSKRRLFTEGQIDGSQPTGDYETTTNTTEDLDEQGAITADVSGRLFETPWSGHVALALGAGYRDESSAETRESFIEDGVATIRTTELTAGDFQVAEAYGELSVVPVAGKRFADWLELSAAARVFDYSSSGTGYAWKAGGLWRIAKGFSVRGTYATSFRAPGIRALYAGQEDSFTFVVDPCDTSRGPRSESVQAQCAAEGLPDDFEEPRTEIVTRTGGNPELEPETAKTFTVGAVYEPRYVPGLAVTMGYFHVKLTNLLQPAFAYHVFSGCYQARSPEACALITRDADTGLITQIIETEANLGSSKTAGVDVGLRYTATTEAGSRFRFGLVGTRRLKFDERTPIIRLISGRDRNDLARFPKTILGFSTLWRLKQWEAGLLFRFIGDWHGCPDGLVLGKDCSIGRGDRYTSADLHAAYTFESPMGTSRFILSMATDSPPGTYFITRPERGFHLRLVQSF